MLAARWASSGSTSGPRPRIAAARRLTSSGCGGGGAAQAASKSIAPASMPRKTAARPISERLRRVVDHIGIDRILDRGGMHAGQSAVLNLADILMAKHLMGLAVEPLGSLGVFARVGHIGYRLDRLDQRGAILWPAIARRLHARLDHVQRLPAAEHVAVGRHIRRIVHRCAARIDAHGLPIEGLMRAFVRLLVAAHAFPEMAAFEEV